MRLQMVGLMPASGVPYRRDGPTPRSFSILHYVDQRLACVESVNAPKDHLAARKLLETGGTVAPEAACKPELALKQA
jgi:3-phenylpropionate/trans-cinnamate dioxygenase ferredoxin reductase subunit